MSRRLDRVRLPRVVVVGAVILLVLAAFVGGTFVGFRVSLQQFESCHEIPCGELGVPAERCEVCLGDDVLVRLMG